MYKYLIFLFLLACCVGYNPDYSLGDNQDFYKYQNYYKASEYKNERIITVNGKQITNPLLWGEKSADDTDLLQAALDSGADIILIPKTYEAWVSKPLYVLSNTTIYFESGSKLQALRGDFLGKGDTLINIHNAENIHLYGYGATLKMWRDDYDRKPYEKAQWRHSISIKSSKNITLEGFKLLESGGDGVYLGQNKDTNRDIVIRNMEIIDHYRQGISVTSVNGLLIENVYVSGTKGHLPEAGIDFEPNSGSIQLNNIHLNNCVFVNNNGPGFLVSLQNFSGMEKSLDISVKDSTFHGYFWGLSIMNTKNDPYGYIDFENVTFKGIKINLPGKNLEVNFNN